jgi:hypothetical protein
MVIVGLNSAWMCRKSPDEREIAIGEYQMIKAMDELKTNGRLDSVLILFHHLLAGVLYKQGDNKINNLIDTIIERGPKESIHTALPELAKEVALLGGIVQDLSPYNFDPCNPQYKEITQSVMGIFDREVFRSIPVQVRDEAADTLGREGKGLVGSYAGGVFLMGHRKVGYSLKAGQIYKPLKIIFTKSF